MKYLKDNYINPVVNKKRFHEMFPNSYGRKANISKLIVKSLTLLDASIDIKGEYIPAKSTLIITTKNGYLYYISAVINSKLAFFYLSQKYPSSSYNGGITFTKDMRPKPASRGSSRYRTFASAAISKDSRATRTAVVPWVLESMPNA